MRKAVLLRVGIDSGCGGIQSPLFSDGSFEFVCILDNKRVSAHKYGTVIEKNGRPHSACFPARKQVAIAEQHTHLDLEFETFTCGDPPTPKRSLQKLERGRLPDFLLRYAGVGRRSRLAGQRVSCAVLHWVFRGRTCWHGGRLLEDDAEARVREELPCPLPDRLREATRRSRSRQRWTRQLHSHEGPSTQFAWQGPIRETAEGLVARNAEGVRHVRRQGDRPREARHARLRQHLWRRRSSS